MIDIFVFARQRVDNKGVVARIKHSAKFHSLRSAMSGKGSFASKGLSVLGIAARASFKLIPVPIVGDLLGAAHKAVEEKVRGWHHSKRRGQAEHGHNAEDLVKFELKELSVENLDRYRWKLKDAIVDLNRKAQSFDALLEEKGANSKPCHAYLEMAEAVAQAERRFDRLTKLCNNMIEVLKRCVDWCNEQNTEITKFKNEYSKFFAEEVAKEARQVANLEMATPGQGDYAAQMKHLNCVHYCYYKEAAEADNWAVTRSNLADLVREVSAPFEAESFVSFNKEPYDVKTS